MDDEKIRCYNCMEMKAARFRICPYCGYPADTPYDPSYAPPGTELNERYTLGVKIGHNSEGANYIGYNSSIGCKVLIREYMPVGLCKRVRGRATISVNADRVVQYKALMAEFTALNRKLAQMRNLQHIIPTLDMFTANNTTYVVYEYLEGIKLVEYLKDHAGELTWRQVSSMFPTFFTTLSLMHNNCVIHRAISPDTIYVTPRNELCLCGFSIYDVRTMHLELPSELFQGYAAPEQYTPGAKQGTFTDVYGICAVLYRLLTGCQPVDAPSRLQIDNLCAPHELNQNIPKNVSEAIIRGMCLDSERRTQTITELVTQLFEQTEEETPAETKQIPTELLRRNQNAEDPGTPKPEEKKEKPPLPGKETSEEENFHAPLVITVLTICILLVASIIMLSMMNGNGSSLHSQTETTTIPTEATTENNIVTETSGEIQTLTEITGDSQMPALVGMNYAFKKEQLETDGWLYLEPTYQFSNDYEAGLIIQQEIPAGEPFRSGSTVKVVVSRGSSLIQIPDYAGKTLRDYEEELDALGLTDYYHTEAVVNYNFETGYVVELNREAGEIFDLQGDENLKIFYASNPETTPPVTEAPQTTIAVTETAPVPQTTTAEEVTDDSGVILETAPSVAPEPESSGYTQDAQDAPETAPNLNQETGVPDYETAPPVPEDFN